MAGSDKTVKVTLVAVAGPYVKGTNDAANATRKLGGDIDKVEGKSKGFASSAGKATSALKGMAIAGAAVAGAGLVAFLTDSVKAAGDLEQSVGGVDSVFKGTADVIHDFGKNSAEAVGLSTNEFNQLITVTGAMLKNKGLEDFTQKSLDLVTVGADLAAQFGGSTAQAVEALNAAMRGESDPIERYGISLNEAAVKAELAATGADKLTGAALEQAKATARIDIIMRQSADAMGAFGREADTLQGQQQRLSAEWENAKASLGQALLPAITSVTSALRSGLDITLAVAKAFGELPGPVKAAATALVILHLTKGPLGGFATATIGHLRGVTVGLRTMTVGAAAARIGMGALALAGGPVGIAIAGIAAAFGGYMQAQANAQAAAEEFADTLDKVTGKFTEQTRELALNKFFKDFAEQDYSKVAGSLEKAGVGVADLIAAYSKGPEAVDAFKRSFDEWRTSQEAIDLRRQGVNIEALGNAYAALGRDMEAGAEVAKVNADVQGQVASKLGETGEAAKTAAPDVAALAAEEEALKAASEEAAKQSQELASAILEIAGAAVTADQAEAAWQESIDEATAALEENGRTATKNKKALDLTTEAGRNNQDALIGMRDAALKSAEANLENGSSADSVKRKMASAREEFIRVAQKMGLSKTAARDLANQYGLTEGSVDNLKDSMDEIPREKRSRIVVEGGAALSEIESIKRALRLIPDERVSVFVNTVERSARGVSYGVQRAEGGPVYGKGTATSDSIPAWLSNGEYVVKAAAVAKYGTQFFDHVNAMRLAEGGHVSRMSPVSIDYDRLAGVVQQGGITLNAYGSDAEQATRRALRDFEFKAVSRL